MKKVCDIGFKMPKPRSLGNTSKAVIKELNQRINEGIPALFDLIAYAGDNQARDKFIQAYKQLWDTLHLVNHVLTLLEIDELDKAQDYLIDAKIKANNKPDSN